MAFFNPENLSTGELTKATFKILSASIGLIVGMIVKENLVILQAMPFGDEIAIFLSGFSSGIVILGLNYFIEQSEIMQKVWTYLDKIKSKYEKTVDHFKEINAELDRYVLELTQLGFGFNITELSQFAYQLEAVNSELECNILLKQEVEKQGIVLPFEIGNQESTINWLLELSQK